MDDIPSDFLASGSLDSAIRRMGGELVGRQIGVYRIASPLGAGGMGEVYRARDTRLERDVAIKVLPPAFTDDADRLARFQREARVLASLNHPNIAAIHDFEVSGGISALVLELVEGKTLAERLTGGALPIGVALKYARQIAEALDAAHERGIVHRDLKPANIKITPEATIKILDFGLAKSVSSVDDDSRAEQTLETKAGLIVGTAAYMSPEQARGQAVDKRTDIWAFGCLLFEMLTGKPVFEGSTTSDVIAAVLERNPDWSAVPTTVPAATRRTLQRCLEKDPKRRVRDIGDVIDELDPSLPMEAAPLPPRRTFLLLASIFVTVIISFLVGWSAWEMKPDPRLTVTRFTYRLPEGQRLSDTYRHNVAISPDGTQLAYVADRRLYLKRLSDSEATPIAGDGTIGVTGTIGVASPVFSPDGRSIAFYSPAEGLLKVVAGKTAPTTICRLSNPYGISWDGDDILYAERGKGILRVSPKGGEPEVIVPVDASEIAYAPQMLPDGLSVLYTLAAPTRPRDLAHSWNTARVVVQRLGSADRKTVISGGSEARYLPTGHVVYAAGETLHAVPYDVGRAEVVGAPVPLVDGITRSAFRFGTAHFSVSNNGTLIYLSDNATSAVAPGEFPYAELPGYNPRRRLVWVDRQGGQQPISAAPSRAYLYPRISPDGTRVAIDVRDAVRDQSQNIVVWDFAREALTPLIIDAIYPVWTRDGRHIVYGSGRDSSEGVPNLYRQAADGSGDAERLTHWHDDQSPHALTPDNKQLILRQFQRKAPSAPAQLDLFLLNLDTTRRKVEGTQGSTGPKSLLATEFSENNPELSPDGRWLAYESDESGHSEIYIRPFPNVDDSKIAVSSGGGTRPVWARDGRELFYMSGFTPNPVALMSVTVQPGLRLSLGKPRRLFEGPYFAYRTNVTGRTYDVSPDGKRFLMINNQVQETGDAPSAQGQIFVVLNWFEELKQKAPRTR